MIYCAQSISLATLEILVDLDFGQALHRYVSIQAEFDDDLCKQVSSDQLPQDWAVDPPSASTRHVGSAWVAAGNSAVLAVPSVVVASETNYLINPVHPDFARIEIGSASPLKFDPRLHS
jgi:RES domain-containing protein